jgi:PAS domain S-box-containing protein
VNAFLRDNADYLVFAGSMAALFAAAAFILPRARRRATIPGQVFAVAAAVLLLGWRFAEEASRNARKQIERSVEALAPTYASELERMGHASITPETRPDDPRYLAIVDAILRWQAANQFAHDIYTIRAGPGGKHLLIVDPETDYDRDGRFAGKNERRTPIGTEYPEQDDGLDAALAGRVNFNPEIVRDEWGEWVGAWAPIRGPDGGVEAAVGVDFAAGEWLRASRANSILQIGLALLVIGVGGVSMGLIRAELARRVESEATARRAQVRLATMLQRMPLCFIEWSPKGECIAWNPAAERVFGYKPEEILGQAILPRIVAPTAREHVGKVWDSLMRDTGGTHSINENLTRDGRTILCEWFNTPLTGSDGKVTGAFSIVQDITERVELEKHVRHAQRIGAVGQLAAGVAHDFNNILTVITGQAGLLLQREELPPAARADIQRIEEAALRASGLTRQLLTFSRQQAMFVRPLHLEEVVRNSAAMLGRILGENISMEVRIAEGAPAVEADPAMIDQVITNLAINARDAMPSGGTLVLSLSKTEIAEAGAGSSGDADARAGTAVCLSVSDTGTGIAPEDLNRIFEPFFTTKPPGKGTGLGLSVVHGIVKQHHGWIEVDSKPGKGTAFRVFLPPTDKAPGSESGRHPGRPAGTEPARSRTVLLVEDEEIVRELARLILERSGFRVLEAGDGNAALALWAEHKDAIDLLLTDMVMPGGISGLDLSRRLLAERPGLPVIYASGYSVDLTAPGFRETERLVFLQKPYLTDQLVTTVHRVLGEPGH